MGKTETEDYTVEKIEEEYGLEPLDLIEVKGLMGDASDNIPGVPGVGEKTALNLIKQYKNIDEVYKKEDVPSDEILIKDDQFEEEEFRKHRTEITIKETSFTESVPDKKTKIFRPVPNDSTESRRPA